jgi:transglutaminase-like putative cysteine protease
MVIPGLYACGPTARNTASESDSVKPTGKTAGSQLTVLSIAGGDVLVLKQGEKDWVKGEEGMTLGVNYKIKTAGGNATLTFFEGSTIELEANTEIGLTELSSVGTTNHIKLTETIGETISRVKKLTDPASSYQIETQAAVAAVRGTTMYVAVSANGTTTVGNIEGSAFVIVNGVETPVSPGMRLTVEPGKPAGPQEPGAMPGITPTGASQQPTTTVTQTTTTETTSTAQSNSVLFTNPATYDLTYEAAVTNGSFIITDLSVYQPCPVEWDSQKNVVVKSVSPASASKNLDSVYGNGIYCWNISGQPGPGTALTFSVKANLTVYETLTQINAAAVQPYNSNSAVYALNTKAEKYIESNDPAIIQLAGQIAGQEQNPYLTARKFYDYIIQNYNFKILNQGLRGAKAMADTKEGEAGDFAALFVALCRARGIPTRPIVGATAQSGLNNLTVWAEFYLEQVGWIPVDAMAGLVDAGKRDYYFGNMDNGRIILNKGYNITLVPAAPDNFTAAYLQVPFYWFWGSGGDSSTVTIQRSLWSVTKLP